MTETLGGVGSFVDRRLPLVSVIIPHFERMNLLRETLDSLASQTFENWEALVVDDGSRDDDWIELQRLETPRVRILRRKDDPQGPGRCRNLGLANARGHYVLFLDSDDLLAPWCLQQRLLHVSRVLDADLCVFPVLLFRDTPGDCDLMWNEMDNGDNDLHRFLRSDPPWCVSSPLWKTQALKSIGGFNERVVYGDDADLHTRGLLAGLPYRKIKDALPDVFIRRSNADRITSRLSPELIELRRIRLVEGTELLQDDNASPELMDLWEGQYFVEAEFLLFNASNPGLAIRCAIDEWVQRHRPSWFRRSLVKTYFLFGQKCRQRAYLFLRFLRRLAMQVLPEDYFPKGGQFESARLDSTTMRQVRSRLA